MSTWQDFPIKRRTDGSYVIVDAGLPYHVPNMGEWVGLWAQVNAYVAEHPDQVTDDPVPHKLTQEELLEHAKHIRTAEFNHVMSGIDAKLIRSATDLLAATLEPATLAEGADGVDVEELEQSRVVFTKLKAMQAQNRALRAAVLTAETIEAVEAIKPLVNYDE